MGQERHLERAPLREALIDVQFSPPITLDAVQKFAASKEPLFGKRRDVWHASIGMEFGDEGGPKTSSDSVIVGARLDATSQPHVAQFRTTGFTFSRLYPYENWAALRDPAVALWREYAASAGVHAASRIALRYINELRLPLPIKDFGDYLTVSPQIPKSLPQGLAGFLHRVVIVNEKAGILANVTQAMEDTPAGAPATEIVVVLDIDVFSHKSTPVNDTIFNKTLEDLRLFKNEVFFDYLTEQALELFK